MWGKPAVDPVITEEREGQAGSLRLGAVFRENAGPGRGGPRRRSRVWYCEAGMLLGAAVRASCWLVPARTLLALTAASTVQCLGSAHLVRLQTCPQAWGLSCLGIRAASPQGHVCVTPSPPPIVLCVVLDTW